MDENSTDSEALTASLKKRVDAWLHTPWFQYPAAFVLVALGTALDMPFHTRIAPTNLAMIYLVAVVITAAYLGRGPAILTSILSVLAFDYFYVPPFLTLRVFDTEYLITFAGFLGVALTISELTVRLREQAEAAEGREQDTAVLYALSRDLAVAEGTDAILKALTRHIRYVLDCEVSLLLAGQNKVSELAVQGPFDIPLRTSQGMLGILHISPGKSLCELNSEQRRLLEAFANQAAQAIERAQLAERAGQVQVMQETERLQSALLNSISHDLRTPLVSITGSLSTLKEDSVALDQELRTNLVENAYQEAGRLNRIVSNLLNMTRLEAGAMKVNKRPEDVQDMIGSALEQLRERLGSRPVKVTVEPDTPLVPMDFVLMVQVMVNLIDNAIKYSPDGAPIEIQASCPTSFLHIRVTDRGVGIPAADLEFVFDKFHQVRHPSSALKTKPASTGLGLSICKGITEAHGGSIWAENRPGGGAMITLALPIGDVGSE